MLGFCIVKSIGLSGMRESCKFHAWENATTSVAHYNGNYTKCQLCLYSALACETRRPRQVRTSFCYDTTHCAAVLHFANLSEKWKVPRTRPSKLLLPMCPPSHETPSKFFLGGTCKKRTAC